MHFIVSFSIISVYTVFIAVSYTHLVFIYEWPNVTRAYDFIKEAVKNDE